MSQIENNPYQGQMDQPGGMSAKKSGLAITALVMSLLALIPCLGLLTAPLGVLLGLIGVVTIGSNPARTGKGMAVAAVIVGLVLGGAQYYGGKKIYDVVAAMFTLMTEGPNSALQTGFAGDIPGFRAQFYGPGATATDAEAKAFLDELVQRYGAYTSATVGQQGGQQPTWGQTAMDVPYVLQFANGPVDAHVELIFGDQATGALVNKIGHIQIVDPKLGDMEYPASAPGGGAASPPAGGSGSGAGSGGGDGKDGTGDDGTDG